MNIISRTIVFAATNKSLQNALLVTEIKLRPNIVTTLKCGTRQSVHQLNTLVNRTWISENFVFIIARQQKTPYWLYDFRQISDKSGPLEGETAQPNFTLGNTGGK